MSALAGDNEEAEAWIKAMQMGDQHPVKLSIEDTEWLRQQGGVALDFVLGNPVQVTALTQQVQPLDAPDDVLELLQEYTGSIYLV